jgi:ribosomal protein L7Ae-like RNA K-turn-binding protein
VDEVISRKLANLLGLGRRGRLIVVGVQQVRTAASKGALVLAVVAPDASRHSLDKVVPLLKARRISMIEGPSAAVLGAAVGRESTAAVGVVDRQLARGVRALFEPGSVEPEGRPR